MRLNSSLTLGSNTAGTEGQRCLQRHKLSKSLNPLGFSVLICKTRIITPASEGNRNHEMH